MSEENIKIIGELKEKINHLKQIKNPFISDEPSVTINNVIEIIEFLVIADDHKENHGLEDKHESHYSIAKSVLLKLSKGALNYESSRIEVTA